MDGQTSNETIMSRFDDMLHRLRLRICMMDPDHTHILYENSLAEEFGVSRTPVRQVLQRLAYEHQVETRTGIGTVVPQLSPDGMTQDIRLLSGLLDLASTLGDSTNLPQALAEKAQLLARGANCKDTSTDQTRTQIFETHSDIIALSNALMPEPVLADAAAALHWRILRRLLQQDASCIERQRDLLQQLSSKLSQCGNAQAVLRLIAIFIADLMASAPPRT